jgi:hypothetical protein
LVREHFSGNGATQVSGKKTFSGWTLDSSRAANAAFLFRLKVNAEA